MNVNNFLVAALPIHLLVMMRSAKYGNMNPSAKEAMNGRLDVKPS